MEIKYEYPANGYYAETVVKIDGRVFTVNAQHSRVFPHGTHDQTCDQLCKMGGRCNCGLLEGVNVERIVEDARRNGKFGKPPANPVAKPVGTQPHSSRVCRLCNGYCYGDCEAQQN